MNITTGEEAGTHFVFHFVGGGISVQITCTGFSTPGAKFKNGVGAGGVMNVTGTGKFKFAQCVIAGSEKAAANCQVPETLETVTIEQTTEGDKFTIKSLGGGGIVIVPFTSRPGKKCPEAIIGEKAVTGTLRGEAASPTAIEFTSASGSELKIGEAAAQWTAVIHYKTKNSPEHPIAIETP